MKTIKLILVALLFSKLGVSQGFIQSSFTPPTCYGMCDGNVVFTSTATTGPFTAVLTNSASCPNSTVQNSSGNSITINSLCPCSANYTVSIFNSSMILVGYELLQVPITATAPLTLSTPTIDPTVCSVCCNGSVYVTWSGGFAPTPNDATVSIDGSNVASYFPNPNVCVGQHTICVTDLSNCSVCTTFSMNYVTHVGLQENKANDLITISPNPSSDKVTIHCHSGELVYSVKCFDLNGKLVLESNDPNGFDHNLTYDVSLLRSGIYYMELSTQSHTLGRQKLVKIE